jgi:glycerol-3-phosphate acyltransferase PlsY
LPTGVVLGRLAGVDVRASGSGNVGATNVARTAGSWWGVLTLLVDVAKGAIPVLIARRLDLSPAMLALVGLGAFYGHIFSVFSGLRGGKGVATAAGVFLILAPPALAGAALMFIAVAALSRLVSLASLSAALTLPVAVWLTVPRGPELWSAVVVAVTVVLTHRDNLRRLLAGTEGEFRPKHN